MNGVSKAILIAILSAIAAYMETRGRPTVWLWLAIVILVVA